LQNRLANEQAFDVLVPGERPGGAAAIVQADPNSKGSRVDVRGSIARDAVADINACL
jgi:alkyl hydroperoxide reductase subunit AhpF